MARKRLNFSLQEESEKLLRSLALKTGLKMSTIVEKAIKLFSEQKDES